LAKESEKVNKIFNSFDPYVFGATFWQTLITNWWYNVGKDIVKDSIKISRYWYDVYFNKQWT